MAKKWFRDVVFPFEFGNRRLREGADDSGGYDEPDVVAVGIDGKDGEDGRQQFDSGKASDLARRLKSILDASRGMRHPLTGSDWDTLEEVINFLDASQQGTGSPLHDAKAFAEALRGDLRYRGRRGKALREVKEIKSARDIKSSKTFARLLRGG
jgi:hypothetical protein